MTSATIIPVRMRLAVFPYSRDWGYCLMDEPAAHDFDFPEMPPGAMYDTDHQCRLQYGQDAMYCEGIDVSLTFPIYVVT